VTFFCARQARAKEHEDALSRGSDCLYACGFRIYFTPLPGFFSPFPHGTGSLSVDYEYLALEDGPPIFRQDFSCPALLLANLVPPPRFRLRGYHPLWPAFPDRSANAMAKDCRLLRFRSPLLSESRLISVPPATEMFQFTGFASRTLCIQVRMTHTQLALNFRQLRSLEHRGFCAHLTYARKPAALA
jgi:hypothetical protein